MGRQRVCAIRPADREMPQAKHIQSAIEALLLDEDGIGQIETRLGSFNIFEHGIAGDVRHRGIDTISV